MTRPATTPGGPGDLTSRSTKFARRRHMNTWPSVDIRSAEDRCRCSAPGSRKQQRPPATNNHNDLALVRHEPSVEPPPPTRTGHAARVRRVAGAAVSRARRSVDTVSSPPERLSPCRKSESKAPRHRAWHVRITSARTPATPRARVAIRAVALTSAKTDDRQFSILNVVDVLVHTRADTTLFNELPL